MENMNVKIEIWPLAADHASVWLVSGREAWTPALPVGSADDIHDEVEALLYKHGVLETTTLIHSTSWRPDGPSMVVTYVAVLRTDGPVIADFPDARPVGLDLADKVGRPPMHGATEVPVPRYVDVLLHAIRHLRFLLDNDDESATGITLPMRRHIEKLRPALAGMYRASA